VVENNSDIGLVNQKEALRPGSQPLAPQLDLLYALFAGNVEDGV